MLAKTQRDRQSKPVFRKTRPETRADNHGGEMFSEKRSERFLACFVQFYEKYGQGGGHEGGVSVNGLVFSYFRFMEGGLIRTRLTIGKLTMIRFVRYTWRARS